MGCYYIAAGNGGSDLSTLYRCDMDPIALIREKLAAFPKIRINDVPDGIRIEAPNEGGFAVTIEGWPDHNQWFVIAGDGLDHWFEEPDRLLDHVAFLLSDEAALCEWYRNDELIGASVGPVSEHTSLPSGTFDDPASDKTVKIFRNRLSPKPDLKP